MHTHSLRLPALALFLTALPLAAADKVTLRQHWEPGKVYHLEAGTAMEMTVPGLPGGGTQNTNVTQAMDVTVTKEPGTERKLAEMKIASVKAIITMGDQLMTYDSQDPAMSQPMLQQAFGAIVGKSVTLIYDKDDKFLDAIIPEGFIPTPLGAGTGPDGKQFATMLRDSVDFGLPLESLAVGGAFTQEKTLDMKPLGSVTTKIKGRFDSIIDHEGRKHAKLLAEGTMEMPAAAPGAAPAMVAMLPGSKLTSETLFDLDRKAVTRSTATNDLKMSAAGKEMTMKQTIITTLKSITDAPAPKK